MKVLVIGGGGREHAIIWRLTQSPKITKLFIAPGNTGSATETKTTNVPIAADNIEALKAFALKENIDLTIVGPEAPLVAGIVDEFTDAGLKCFGPSAYCAQLEGSKSFAKHFLEKNNIPTANYAVFENLDAAIQHVKTRPLPMVIKADGLAAGKGVFIAHRLEEALTAVNAILDEKQFGTAGASLIVEDFLEGEEASFIVMADGTTAIALASSQDHKARDEGDLGPNTGGMGAYSPAPVVSPKIHEQIMNSIILPTIAAMKAAGHPYIGFLYAGVMISPSGDVRVLEFNCRLGDPEAQPLMMRLNSCLASLCLDALNGELHNSICIWDKRIALGVVLTSKGYPESFPKGEVIQGLDAKFADDQKIFHAGTAYQNGKVVTAGGRVLTATALGNSFKEASDKAYALSALIHWPNIYYRKDIGHRALNR
jgi:phosphoribosylamine--glycine ligase